MRLIDAEGEYVIEASDNTGYKIECKNGIALLSDKYGQGICEFIIGSMPVAFDVDNIMDQLEEKTELAYNRYMDCHSYNPASERYKTQYQERKMCLDIVKTGMENSK